MQRGTARSGPFERTCSKAPNDGSSPVLRVSPPRWSRRIDNWYSALTDRQRVVSGLATMVFLGASSLYLLGIGSMILVSRLPPPAPPVVHVVQVTATPGPTTPVPTAPSTAEDATAMPLTTAAVEATTPPAATEEGGLVATTDGPPPIAAPDVPTVHAVPRLPAPVADVPDVSEPVDEPPPKPRVVETPAQPESPLAAEGPALSETPRASTTRAPGASLATPYPGGEAGGVATSEPPETAAGTAWDTPTPGRSTANATLVRTPTPSSARPTATTSKRVTPTPTPHARKARPTPANAP